MLNKSQQKYISDQLGTIGSIFLGTLVVTNFLPDNVFNLKIFLISLGVTLVSYITGVIFRQNVNA
jgi:hypothetical protein